MADENPNTKTSLLTNAWTMVLAVVDLVSDFSFKTFVTPKLVRIIYALSLVAALLWALTWMFGGFKAGVAFGLFSLITGPLAFLFYVLCARVAMELVLAVFSIEAELKKLNARKKMDE